MHSWGKAYASQENAITNAAKEEIKNWKKSTGKESSVGGNSSIFEKGYKTFRELKKH